jgi:hypothetical protein
MSSSKRWRLCPLPLLSILLSGCVAQPYAWTEWPVKQPLPAYVFSLSVAELQAKCRHGLAEGCAIRDYEANACRVYVGPSPRIDTLAHEFAHCAGFEH